MRFDTFENEEEMSKAISKLQAQGPKYMTCPDDFWHTKVHAKAMKSAREMTKKILAQY